MTTTQLPFKARCAQGHARIDFAERLAFETHMAGTHGRTKPRVGGPENQRGAPAPGWSRATSRLPRPYPWKAPRPTLDRELLDALESDELVISFDEELDGPDVLAVIEATWDAYLSTSRCEVCGDPIDYCLGHGELG